MTNPAIDPRTFSRTTLPFRSSNRSRKRSSREIPGIVFLLVLMLAGCDAATTTDVPEAPQLAVFEDGATVRIISGDEQTASPGENIKVEIEVADARGQAIRKVFVYWAIKDGGGSTQHAVTRTNGRGRARTLWSAGPEPGTQVLEAGVPDLGSVTFTATVVAEEGAEEEVGEGDPDEGDPDDGDPDDGDPDEGDPDDGGSDGENTGTLGVTPGNLTMTAIGAEAQLQVEAKDADGNEIGSSGVTWTSSDESIVTVNEEGKVLAMAAGTALVIAAATCCTSDTATVTVEQDVHSVEVSPESVRLAPGETARLEAEALDSNGNLIPGAAFTWSSDDTSVATVDQSGRFTGVGEGTTEITATSGGVSDHADIEVFIAQAPDQSSGGIWMSPEAIARRPASGTAWNNVKKAADTNLRGGVLTDRDDHNVRVMAAALVAARLNDDGYRARVRDALMDLTNASLSDDGLALNRRLVAYVAAADLIGLSSFDGRADAAFRSWLERARTTSFGGGGGGTVADYHERRPNNWGTMAGASRMAAALYLGDTAEFERAVRVFRGWLGDRSAYAGFKYSSDQSWQADESAPVGINPRGATRDGRNIDGVLPDDQRRCGSFDSNPWPCDTNYSYGGLAGALAQAQILHQQGYDVFSWEDRALLRAMTWLHNVADKEADGDREWQTHLVNGIYGTSFPEVSGARPGKNVGWSDWTH